MRAIGIDVHGDFCEVAICEGGCLRSAGRVASRPEELEVFAASLAATTRSPWRRPATRSPSRVSSSRTWRASWWLAPKELHAISDAKAKTDRRDARTLAKLLAGGLLEAPIYRTASCAPCAGG